MSPLVSLIVIQYGDPSFLWALMRSVARLDYPNLELVIVDNGSPKVSLAEGPRISVPVRHVPAESNLGFGGGLNLGIQVAQGEYLFLLNNDIEIDPGCIAQLAEAMNSDPSIGMLQPKILDLQDPSYFHSSGAGGMMDIFGYPFARGRIFDTVEKDAGQYDRPIEVFWASGASVFVRREAVEQAGLFDPDFFLYMEEIDLAWRLHLIGRYRIVFAPSARVYHLGCPNLERANFMRMYYVHRNSLIMLLKNYACGTLLCLLPGRLLLELAVAFQSLLVGEWRRAAAIFRAFGSVLHLLPSILRKRREVQARRAVGDKPILARMYWGSIALKYVVAQRRISEIIAAIPTIEYRHPGEEACP